MEGVPLGELVQKPDGSERHDGLDRNCRTAVILAAGQGSRFVADIPKVIYPFHNRPLGSYVIDAALRIGMQVVLVVGHEREKVVEQLRPKSKSSIYSVVQDEQLGTGHAVFMSTKVLPDSFQGDVLIAYADTPGVDATLLNAAFDAHEAFKTRYGDRYGATILTGTRELAGAGAAAYGRIIRSEVGGTVVDIVEKKQIDKMSPGSGKYFAPDAFSKSKEELDNIDEFNSGIVIANAKQYFKVLAEIHPSQIKTNPPKFEYYATDFVKGMVAANLVVEGWSVPSNQMYKLEGANTVTELEELEQKIAAPITT